MRDTVRKQEKTGQKVRQRKEGEIQQEQKGAIQKGHEKEERRTR